MNIKIGTINFMGIRNIAFAVTLILTVIALGSWFTKGINFGLDFTGGTLIELTYEQPADLGKVRGQLVGAGYEDAVVQSFGDARDVLVRMPSEDPELGKKVATALQQADTGNPANLKRVEYVGPQVGEELRDQGASACSWRWAASCCTSASASSGSSPSGRSSRWCTMRSS